MRDDDSGQGLTEMALMLPLLVLLVLATLFLVDIARAKARAHEVARYSAFASTHVALRDYDSAVTPTLPVLGMIGGQMQTATTQVKLHAQTYYKAPPGTVVGKIGETTVGFEAAPFNYLPLQTADEVQKALGGNASSVLSITGTIARWVMSFVIEAAGFEGSSVLTATATVPIDFKVVPWQYLGVSTGFAGFKVTEKVTVMGDPWALGDGRDVWAGGYLGTAQGQTKTTVVAPLQKQVSRLYLAGGIIEHSVGASIKDFAGKIAGALGRLVSDDTVITIFSAHVSMKNYGLREQAGAIAPTGTINVFAAADTAPIDRDEIQIFDTTQMRDDPQNPDGSRQVQGMQQRGPYFRGCRNGESLGCVQTRVSE